MAAPTLQAEAAALTGVTSGACAPTIPTHQTDDILFASVFVWVPNTAGTIYDIPTPANWTKLGSVDLNGATKDGQMAWFWTRATAAGTTVSFARGTVAPGTTAWDTGTDGLYAGRVDVIRGCIRTGNPYDDFQMTAESFAANTNTPAVTVSGADRLVMIYSTHDTDASTARFTALTGFALGTHRGLTTGTGGGIRPAYLATGSSHSATATTHTASTAPRSHVLAGISFIPAPPTTLPLPSRNKPMRAASGLTIR